MSHPGTIAVSRRAAMPLAVGLCRPTVLIPDRLLPALSETELEDVLVHECAHCVRRDLVVGLLQRFLAVLCWPHPLIHVLNRRLSRAREEVCDNHVLRGGDARCYAATLLTIAEHITAGAVPVGFSLLPPHWELEDRVAGLLDKRRNVMTRINRLLLLSLFAVPSITAVVIAGVRLAEATADEPIKAVEPKPAATPIDLGKDDEPGSNPIVALNKLGISVGIIPPLPWRYVHIPKDQVITEEMVQHLSRIERPQIYLSGSQNTNDQLRQLKKVNAIDSLTLNDTGVTDEGLALLKGMNTLRVLDISKTGITDSGLSQLKGLNNLESLSISDTLITDNGLRQLRALPALRDLSLGNLWIPGESAITDSGMNELATLRQLGTLDLTGLPITDTGLKSLSSLTSLYFLSLTDTKVGDSGLKHLENMTKLDALHLGNTQVGDRGLLHLKGLPLSQISLNGTHVTDAGVKHLEGMNSIGWLDLSNTGLTDEAIQSIQRLSRLDVLKIVGTKVTREGIARLKNKLQIRLIVAPEFSETSGEEK